MRRIFLACPYGHPNPEIVETRFVLCNQIAAQIARAGHCVFSQVSMSHPINGCLQDLDRAAIGALWAPIDAVFMEAMTEIIVVDTDGWRESSGVRREMEIFEARGLPVRLWSEAAQDFV